MIPKRVVGLFLCLPVVYAEDRQCQPGVANTIRRSRGIPNEGSKIQRVRLLLGSIGGARAAQYPSTLLHPCRQRPLGNEPICPSMLSSVPAASSLDL